MHGLVAIYEWLTHVTFTCRESPMNGESTSIYFSSIQLVNWDGVMIHFLEVCIGMRVLIAYTLFLGKFWPHTFVEG